MIYLVSNQKSLFECKDYEEISPSGALNLLQKEAELGADTETQGLNPWSKKLLSVQLGNEEFQIVWDCSTVPVQLLKPIFESKEKTTVWWNACFDLKFLYHQGIIPEKVYDGMLAEKLMWLGYPPGMHSMALKAAGELYCGVELDKSVRGKIITQGLTPEVIVYAANDVKYLLPIKRKQMQLLEEKDLVVASQMENEFVRCLAYIEYCGVKLDVEKWKAKMQKDLAARDEKLKELNEWIVDYYISNSGSNNYIEKKVLVDSQFIHPGDRDTKGLKFFDEIPKTWKPVRNSSARDQEYGLLYYTVYKIPFPYIKVDYQGDLFTGFDTTPKCTLNWDSSKQIIPVFELLGFKLETFDKATRQKKKSIDAKILEPQKDVCSIAQIYLDYRAAQKVVTTYGDNFLKAITKESGRIHPDFFQLQDTGRLSSGGGESGVNIQNLPHDKETRACFVAEKGNKWISCDYQSQESRLIASIANDPAMIELFEHGCGDVHSLVAKMAYSQYIPKDLPIEEVKAFSKASIAEGGLDYRQEAKGVEFAINYGGDANTIANNKGIPLKEAEQIYADFMKGFPGVKRYQDFCRWDVMDKGYILLSPVTRHKAYIYDYDELKRTKQRMQEEGFWEDYNYLKKNLPGDELVQSVKHYFKRKAASEKQSINYRIQGAGALCFKLASIKLFRYLKEHDLLFKVKYCVPVHDEINLECPEEIADQIAKVLVKCMEDGAKPFCKRVHLGADVEIGDHWIH